MSVYTLCGSKTEGERARRVWAKDAVILAIATEKKLVLDNMRAAHKWPCLMYSGLAEQSAS